MIELKITDENADGLLHQLSMLAAGLTTFSAPSRAKEPDCPSFATGTDAQVVRGHTAEEAAATVKDQSRRGRKPKAEVAEEAAPEADVGEPTVGAEETTKTASAATPEVVAAGTSALDAPASADAKVLDFDEDVTPVVLGYVRSKGKPWVVDILTQFGVARASELDPSQYGELVDALNAAAEG